MKWSGFGHRDEPPKEGELVLFCPACPQPGINVSRSGEADLSQYVVPFIACVDTINL